LVADAETALKALPLEIDKPAASAARAPPERAAGQDVEPDGKGPARHSWRARMDGPDGPLTARKRT